MIKQLIHLITLVLPFLKKKNSRSAMEFTELIKSQYSYLMEIIEKFQKDYFAMSEQFKEVNRELIILSQRLQEAIELQCHEVNCGNRKR